LEAIWEEEWEEESDEEWDVGDWKKGRGIGRRWGRVFKVSFRSFSMLILQFEAFNRNRGVRIQCKWETSSGELEISGVKRY